MLLVVVCTGDALAGNGVEQQFLIVPVEIEHVEKSAGLFVEGVASESRAAQPVVFDKARHRGNVCDGVVHEIGFRKRRNHQQRLAWAVTASSLHRIGGGVGSTAKPGTIERVKRCG